MDALKKPLAFAIAFAIAVGVVDWLTASRPMNLGWTATYVAIGFCGGGLIGLALTVVAGTRPPVAAQPDATSGPPKIISTRTLWLLALYLPLAGLLGGWLLSRAGMMLTLFISTGSFVFLGLLGGLVAPRSMKHLPRWRNALSHVLVLAMGPFLFPIALMLGTAMFWWVVPLVAGRPRFDEAAAIDLLNPWLPVVGGSLGVFVFVGMVVERVQMSKRRQDKGPP